MKRAMTFSFSNQISKIDTLSKQSVHTGTHTHSQTDKSLSTRLLSVLLFALSIMLGGVAHALDTKDPFSGAQSEPEFLKVDEAFVFNEEIVPGGVKLSWDVTEGYYLYLERFKFKGLAEGVEVGEPQFSTKGELKEDPYFGEVHVIHEDINVFVPITLNGVTDTELKVSYQGCAEAGLCYPPTHKRIMYIPIEADETALAARTTSTAQSSSGSTALKSPQTQLSELDNASNVFDFIESASLPMIIGIFFLLGLGLTFTPCVFPMIPIISSIIAGQEKPTMTKSFILALAYVLGMAITYAAAGVATGLLGAGANVQAALQNPYLLSVFALIFFVLALAMFGVYELQLPAFLRDRLNTKSQSLSGGHLGSVFFIGALSALVVSPCVSAPLAGALLYISATADAVIGGASLFALGMGMGVPLIIVAVGGGKFFPKAGQWMDAVKGVFGVMLIAVAIWLISRFAPAEISMVLWALLLGLSATQMGAFDAASTGWPRIFKGLGLILGFYAAMLLLGAASGGTNPLKPLAHMQGGLLSGGVNPQANIKKLPFTVIGSYDELDQKLAQQSAQPTIVDFYADWCISCKIMEAQVFPLPHIDSKMRQFQLLKADVTANNDAHKKLMDQFGLFGPPSILFFDNTGKELTELRIVGEITAEDFDKRLAQALESS